MWTTTFKHSEGVVEEMTHDFGNNVKVVTNLQERTISRYHGGVKVKEYTLDEQVGLYLRLLEIIAEEVSRCAEGEKVA
jgi:hypothetical protein